MARSAIILGIIGAEDAEALPEKYVFIEMQRQDSDKSVHTPSHSLHLPLV